MLLEKNRTEITKTSDGKTVMNLKSKQQENRCNSEWFVKDRFGLFIHWGLYSLASRCEWVMQHEEINAEEYRKRYFDKFDPDLFNPEQWAELAFDAGMKYVVMTTKHHEGFCLWDTKYTDYKSTNSPAGRDFISPVLKAFRAKEFKTGLYYSLLDWSHPEFVIDDLHVLRNSPDRENLNKIRDQKKYIQYLHAQVEELLTSFGKLDVMWLDYSYPNDQVDRPLGWRGKGRDDWDSEKLYKMVKSLQPGIMLNDRLNLNNGCDFKTPEQFQPCKPVTLNGKPVPWEICLTLAKAWGYRRDESDFKSVNQLIKILIDTVSKNGNLLLNVGPTGRGELDQRAVDRLRGIGRWMKYNKKSIYECGMAPEDLACPRDCRLTYNSTKNRLYIHCFDWPAKQLLLPGYANKIEYAQLLHDASEVIIEKMSGRRMEFEGQEVKDNLILQLPAEKPNMEVPVIEVFLKQR